MVLALCFAYRMYTLDVYEMQSPPWPACIFTFQSFTSILPYFAVVLWGVSKNTALKALNALPCTHTHTQKGLTNDSCYYHHLGLCGGLKGGAQCAGLSILVCANCECMGVGSSGLYSQCLAQCSPYSRPRSRLPDWAIEIQAPVLPLRHWVSLKSHSNSPDLSDVCRSFWPEEARRDLQALPRQSLAEQERETSWPEAPFT